MVETELEGFEPETLLKATATIVLAGWCFLQRDLAPSLEFLRSFNSFSGLVGLAEESVARKQWRELLGRYGYRATDELDEVILDSVSVGYFRGSWGVLPPKVGAEAEAALAANGTADLDQERAEDQKG